jgi:hypothetical protein
MVSRESFINKIRELGYTFKDQQKRTYLWRKVGGTHFIPVPKSDNLSDDFVISSLRHAGCKDPEIQAFLSSAKT